MRIRACLRTSILLFVFAFALRSACAAPADKNSDVRAPIVMEFPDTYSMGELYILKRSASSNDSEPASKTHSPARGRLRFPPGTRAILEIGFDGSQHMSDLNRLDPNCLFGINMKRMEITDDDLKYVARLTGLEHVELEGTDISSKGIFIIEPLKKLRFLGADKTLIKGDAMKSIGKHTTLVNLVIGHNSLDDQCYKDLVGLKNVTNLQVDNTHLSDKGLDYIIKMPSLEVIKLSGNNRIGDTSMAKFQNSKVKALNVQSTGVGPRSVPYFLKMPRLKHLKLEGRNFTPAQQKEAKEKLSRVTIQFQGKERDFPKELFDPLH